LQLVTGSERGSLGNSNPIDVGSVGASEVDNDQAVPIAIEFSVLSADTVAFQYEPVCLCSTDYTRKIDNLGLLPVSRDESQLGHSGAPDYFFL